MSHNDVQTLFHEFGHLVHFLSASRSRWLRLNGLPAETDANEVTSMLAEEWITDTRTLQAFARHYQTGEPISAELVDRIRKGNDFGIALSLRFNIGLSKAALRLHEQSPAGVDPDAVMMEAMTNHFPLKGTAGTHLQSGWTHLANPNYTSSYYTYDWSRMIAKDLFTKFDPNDLLNPAASRRLRNLVMTGQVQTRLAVVRRFSRPTVLGGRVGTLAERGPTELGRRPPRLPLRAAHFTHTPRQPEVTACPQFLHLSRSVRCCSSKPPLAVQHPRTRWPSSSSG